MTALDPNPELNFYVVDPKGNLAAANITFSDKYFLLKIEKIRNPLSPISPKSPNSWRNFSFIRRTSSTISDVLLPKSPTSKYNVGHINNEIISLIRVKEVRCLDFDPKLLSGQALKSLKTSNIYGRRPSNKIKIIIILFGRDFNLNKHTLVVTESIRVSDEEMLIDRWLCQLNDLIDRTRSFCYFDQLRLWYLKEFRKVAVKNADHYFRLTIWKSFLTRCHHRVNGVSMESFTVIYDSFENRLYQHNPTWRNGPMTREEFDLTVRYFLHSPQTISTVFTSLIADPDQINFANMLKSTDGNDLEAVIEQHPILKHFVEAVTRYFTYIKQNLGTKALPEPEARGTQDDTSVMATDMLKKFVDRFPEQSKLIPDDFSCSSQALLDYLFSESNSIWDPAQLQVNQDMTKPLSFYWIKSSHNTYLTGDQYHSQSSVESYVRALRQGCRCVEIDVTNGSCNRPIVTHVRTLTTSILLKDVLLAIKENAFLVSQYPLIISVENHCNLRQQKKMAKLFQTIFGKALMTLPDDSTSSNSEPLPSPDQLKNKIIIKGRKISWVYEEGKRKCSRDETIPEENPCDCLFTGELWKKSDNGFWRSCIFVLTNSSLFYTDKFSNGVKRHSAQLTTYKGNSARTSMGSVMESPLQELHVDQPWFHGMIEGGRNTAEKLLMEHKETGMFLVRNMDKRVDKFVLSYYGNEKIYNCEIHEKLSEDNQKLFYLKKDKEEEVFSNIYELIEFYKSHPLKTAVRSGDFHLDHLLRPVPPSTSHESKEWFYRDVDRAWTERVLEKLPLNGAFLGRYRSGNRNEIVISFHLEHVIKHCHIKAEGRCLVVSKKKFQTLEELVEHYGRNAFYRNMKLSYPVGKDLYRQSQENNSVAQIYSSPDYVNSAMKTLKGRARAIQSYKSKEPDLLSFQKGDIINNIVKEEDGWWWGTKEGASGDDAYEQKQFCSSFVEEITELECPFGNNIAEEYKLGIEAKVKPCKDKDDKEHGIKHYIQFKNHDGTRTILGASCSKRRAMEWVDLINHVIDKDKDGKNRIAKLAAAMKDNIAPEFSDLVTFSGVVNRLHPSEIGTDKNNICTTSVKSYDEVGGDRVLRSNPAYFVWYHQHAMTRIYPKGMRLDSSNFSPVRFWNFGSQMVALNYQTADKAMQLNRGKFRQNGNCGYVLKPEFMTGEVPEEGFQFDPTSVSTNESGEELSVWIDVISARHLQKDSTGTINPIVEVEVVGVDEDCTKAKTNAADTGLNPYWNHPFTFKIKCPELAMIQFSVYDVDTFSDKLLLGESTIPVNCMREGYRSVQLCNGYGEPLLSTLLVKVIKP